MLDVGVIDYGAGNITSVMRAVDQAGANPIRATTPEALFACDKLILPGVGASGAAIKKLKQTSLDQALDEAVRKRGISLLGICLGMHLLVEDLYEFGHHKGFGWIPGKVISLKDHGIENSPVPHTGWADVIFHDSLSDLQAQLGSHRAFYFTHSFTLATDSKAVISASVEYEKQLVAGIAIDNICAFQFHPEKSQIAGDILMSWFIGRDH